jgi:Arylsulfotransferase (ASST)
MPPQAVASAASPSATPSSTAAPSTASPSCVPRQLNVSQSLAGGAVTVTPAPESMDASHLTQISFLGVPAIDIADIVVIGSRSGHHTGRLEPYSQGDGASFLPSRPFDQGETVTVHAVLRQGTGAGATQRPFAWRFATAQVDSVSRSLETPPPPPPPPKASELQHFVSRPDLLPPAVDVSAHASAAARGGQSLGDIFLAPYAGPGQYGPMILDSAGGLIWFKPIPHGERAADLRVQQDDGRPVLTWWQDPLVAGGRHDAGVVIADSAYRDVQVVRAGNGYQPDLHAFEITPRGTALFTVYDAVRCNLSAHDGPADGAIADTLVQEIDLHTGLVRYEWHALDHVALADSYMPIGHGGTPVSPWDWFHINAVSEHGPEHEERLLVDSRNTWAAYDVSARSGQVVWRLGGKQSSFHMGAGASPAWQHDAREEPDGTISFFDNGGTPPVHPQSRVIVLSLNTQAMAATLQSSFVHPTKLLAASQGDFQPLADGNWFVGWGQEPFFSEYSPTGHDLFDAHLPASYQSYTALQFPWSGQPVGPPALAVRPDRSKIGQHGGAEAYASWNGATAVGAWRLLGGPSPHALKPLTTVPRKGFETAIALGHAPAYVEAQALGAGGALLGSSRPVRGT